MKPSGLLSLLLLAALSAPAAAETWNRWEYMGGFGGNGFYGVDVLSVGLYHERYGFGVGTQLLQMRGDAWDLRRRGLPDATAHAILAPLPLEARLVLASWEGDPFVEATHVESSNARIELHASICPWARFGGINDVQPDFATGKPTRTYWNNDMIPAVTWDYGIGYDAGQFWSITVGRFDFQTKDDGVYRARRDGRWYAMGRLYYGHTHGRTVGANPGNVFRDIGFKLCRLVGRCGIIEN